MSRQTCRLEIRVILRHFALSHERFKSRTPFDNKEIYLASSNARHERSIELAEAKKESFPRPSIVTQYFIIFQSQSIDKQAVNAINQ
jgi:hypothetical protein